MLVRVALVLAILATTSRADAPRAPDPVAQARAVVDRWLAAQNAGAFADYERLYATRFRGIRRSGAKTVRLDRAAWMLERKRMFGKPMKVSIDKLAIDTSGGRARARFAQRFEAGTYKDVGDKELIIVGSRIVREEMLTSSKAGAEGSRCDALLCKDTSTPAPLVATCERECSAADARACRERAVMSEAGSCGVPRDHAKAIAFYGEACGPDDPMACTVLADDKAKTDPAAALALYRKACDLDDPYACLTLAEHLMPGKPVEAVQVLERICDEWPRSGPGEIACHDAWERYRDGKGVKRDRDKAAEYKRKYENAIAGE